MRGASLHGLIAAVAVVLIPMTLPGQSTPAPVMPSGAQTPARDRDPVLENAKRINSDLQKANIHAGPLYILSRLRVSDIGYTEQFFVPAGDDGGGLAFAVEAPQTIYFVPSRKVLFNVELTPGFSYFDGNNDIDGVEQDRTQFNYSARGGVQFLFNHLFLDLYAARSDALQARVADVNRLATVQNNEIGLGGELKWSSRTRMNFSVRQFEPKFPEDRYQPDAVPLRALLEREERDSRVSVHHRTFPRTSLTAAVEHRDFEFEFATYKNGSRVYAAPGFIWDTGRTTLRAEAGPARVRFDDPGQNEFEGILGSASFGHRYRRLTLFAAAERDVDFTVFANNNYYVLTRGSLGAEYQMTRRFRLRATTSAERDEYDVPVFGNDRTDDIRFSTIGFRYTVRRLEFGVDVGQYDRTSTFGGDEEDGIRYVLHLSFTP